MKQVYQGIGCFRSFPPFGNWGVGLFTSWNGYRNRDCRYSVIKILLKIWKTLGVNCENYRDSVEKFFQLLHWADFAYSQDIFIYLFIHREKNSW